MARERLFQIGEEIAGLHILKELHKARDGDNRYRARCLRCGSEHDFGSRTIRKREQRGTSSCQSCRAAYRATRVDPKRKTAVVPSEMAPGVEVCGLVILAVHRARIQRHWEVKVRCQRCGAVHRRGVISLINRQRNGIVAGCRSCPEKGKAYLRCDVAGSVARVAKAPEARPEQTVVVRNDPAAFEGILANGHLWLPISGPGVSWAR